MNPSWTLDLEVYDDPQAQARYLVHGIDDVLWTDDPSAALDCMSEDLHRISCLRNTEVLSNFESLEKLVASLPCPFGVRPRYGKCEPEPEQGTKLDFIIPGGFRGRLFWRIFAVALRLCGGRQES